MATTPSLAARRSPAATLDAVFAAPGPARVVLETILLKTGMVLSGQACPEQAAVGSVPAATLRCLRRAVPAAVPGIVFLSGGQARRRRHGAPECDLRSLGGASLEADVSPSAARCRTQRCGRGRAPPPWSAAAQTALRHRAACNGLAVQGMYSEAGTNVGGRFRRRRGCLTRDPAPARTPLRIGIAADHGGFELKSSSLAQAPRGRLSREGFRRPQTRTGRRLSGLCDPAGPRGGRRGGRPRHGDLRQRRRRLGRRQQGGRRPRLPDPRDFFGPPGSGGRPPQPALPRRPCRRRTPPHGSWSRPSLRRASAEPSAIAAGLRRSPNSKARPPGTTP